MTQDPLYLASRLTFDAHIALSTREDDVIRAANLLARAGGRLGDYIAGEGIDANVNRFDREAVGEPVDGYLLPVKASVVRRMFALLDEHVPCWNDGTPEHPLTRPTRHTWAAPSDSDARDDERGWRRVECTRCHVRAVEDSSG